MRPFQHFANITENQLASELKLSLTRGLSEREVETRQKDYGLNQIKEDYQSPIAQILIDQGKSPFFVVFIIIALISLMVNEVYNGIVILVCIIINVSLVFFQEYRAESALALLKEYLVRYQIVVREGQEKKINSSNLVPGDLVLLTPGHIITADMRVIEQENFAVDESVLTGESSTIHKNEVTLKEVPSDIYKASNIVFAGTTVISGWAKALVFSTGEKTEVGAIAYLTKASIRESTFAEKLSRLSIFILKLILGTVVLVFITQLLFKRTHISFFDLFIFATALAISVIPEALPAVVTFCMAQGVRRLAKKKVIIKRLSATESMGSVQILCTDKTGTLTENILSVADVKPIHEQSPIFYALLAHETPFETLSRISKGFDQALWTKLTAEERTELKHYKQIAEIPFDPTRRRNVVVVQHKENKTFLLVVRGMVQEILERGKTDQSYQELLAWTGIQEAEGNRVIAIGIKELLPDYSFLNLEEEDKELTVLGCIAFADPLKSSALEAMKKANSLGIHIKILSGDSELVCGAIAHKIGLIDDPKKVITGFEFAKKSIEEKLEVVEDFDVFARVLPDQKFQILQLLQERYEVGYLGDGINDAPALKKADISLAVSDSVDIAREVADIILLKKSLLVIVNGIEEGRIILANTVKYVKATLAANFGHFYSLVLITLFIDYLPMLPMQLLLVNLLTDFPFVAISIDSVDPIEIEKPRHLTLKTIMTFSLIFAVLGMVFDIIFFVLFHRYQPAEVQTGWFLYTILSEVLFVFSARTRLPFYKARRPSFWLIFLALLTIGFTFALPYNVIGKTFIRLVSLPYAQLIIIIGLAFADFIANEILKRFYYYYKNNDAMVL